MDRRLIFPAIVLTASAQQPSPEAAAAEAALRARAQQFFDLQVAKKYRAGEPFVAGDSQDAYYNGDRYNIKGFSIQKVELLDNASRATVTIKADVMFVAPGVPPMELSTPLTSVWKLEDGQWMWYVDPSAAVETPFGKITRPPDGTTAPPFPVLPGTVRDDSTLQQSVTVDKPALTLSDAAPFQTATISNELPGAVDLKLRSDGIAGLSAELDKAHLGAGEKTSIRVKAPSGTKGSGVVHVLVSPLGQQLDIRVTAN